MNGDVLDTGLAATCGACGAAVFGDPLIGGLLGALIASLGRWAVRAAVAWATERVDRKAGDRGDG